MQDCRWHSKTNLYFSRQNEIQDRGELHQISTRPCHAQMDKTKKVIKDTENAKRRNRRSSMNKI